MEKLKIVATLCFHLTLSICCQQRLLRLALLQPVPMASLGLAPQLVQRQPGQGVDPSGGALKKPKLVCVVFSYLLLLLNLSPILSGLAQILQWE